MKRTTSKTRIVRSLPLKGVDHRVGITNCPRCDITSEYGEWDKHAVTLILNEVYGKHGSLAVISECPHCFKKSWVHAAFSSFNQWSCSYPEEWFVPAQEEHNRRNVVAARRFADSLCARCVHLRRLECDTLPIVDCTYGEPTRSDDKGVRMYHHSFTETECPKFVAR